MCCDSYSTSRQTRGTALRPCIKHGVIIIPCWIWCCSSAITQYKINWIPVQRIVANNHLFIASCMVPSVCNIHTTTLLVSQIFIVLLELKLQYSCICCCIVCALRAKGQTFIFVLPSWLVFTKFRNYIAVWRDFEEDHCSNHCTQVKVVAVDQETLKEAQKILSVLFSQVVSYVYDTAMMWSVVYLC